MPRPTHEPPTGAHEERADRSDAERSGASLGPRSGAVVLVHGAWVGDWCWGPLLPHLCAAGHDVHAIALRGHGSRSSESGPHITLADHVTDLVGHIEAWDLVDVVLVAHSYGGRVATRALPLLADRVAHVVYLDAHAPVTDLADDEPAPSGPPTEAAAADGMIRFGEFPPDAAEFGGSDAVEWFLERVVAQSAATLREPWRAAIPGHVRRTYVHATGSGPSRFAPYADSARADPAWRYVELTCSHWLMVARPAEVAAIIDDSV